MPDTETQNQTEARQGRPSLTSCSPMSGLLQNVDEWAEHFREKQHGATLTMLRAARTLRDQADRIGELMEIAEEVGTLHATSGERQAHRPAMKSETNTAAKKVGVQRLVIGLHKLSKIGTGPCGGGGMLGEYHEGVRATEERVRKECRRLLKEFSDADDQSEASPEN